MDKKIKDIDYDLMCEVIKSCSSVTDIMVYFGFDYKNQNMRKNIRRKIKRLGLSISHYYNIKHINDSKNRYTKERLTKLVDKYDTLSDILYELDLLPITSNYETLKKHLNKFEIDYSSIIKKKNYNKYTKDFVSECVKLSSYQSEAILKMGLQNKGGNHKTFKRYIEKYKIDTSHFNYKHNVKNKIPLKDILIKESLYKSTNNLKKRLYKEGLKERECEMCGQTEEWKGKRMSLILDHINGVNNDNRIENLRVVCPNCNATLDTHCGKNKGKRNKKKVEYGFGINDVVDFRKFKTDTKVNANIKKRKVKRPEIGNLINDIKELGYSGTGRKYGVSDNAIRKWVKSEGYDPKII